MFQYHNQRLQISVSREIRPNLLPLPSPSSRGHVEKWWKIDDFRRFWQNSRLPEAGYPRRGGENDGALSFDDFIAITFTNFFPNNFRKFLRGSKSLKIFEKSEFWAQSAQSEASFTKEIQWWQIEKFKIVNFESHDRFFVQKWSLVM